MNTVILTGNISSDVEVRYTQSGKVVATFNMATNEKRGDEQVAQFHRVVAWEKLAEGCSTYQKGKPVGKERPRFSRYSGAYTASRTRDYETKVAVACKSKMRELGLKLTYKPCKVHINVMVNVPKSYTKKRRTECINGVELPTKTPDIDNIVK